MAMKKHSAVSTVKLGILSVIVLLSLTTLLVQIRSTTKQFQDVDSCKETSSVLRKQQQSDNESEFILYGHIHMPRTAGSTLNGELALRYERVCGHKGYSYNAFSSITHRDNLNTTGTYDSVVPFHKMDRIGFEDCDYVSVEEHWSTWNRRFDKWPFPVELHLPCRDPIQHFMSQCNYLGVTFNCSVGYKRLKGQRHLCIVEAERFSLQLLQNFTVKCFNATNLQGYIEYMGERLQRRRMVGSYRERYYGQVGRRNVSNECIWQHPVQQQTLARTLELRYDYYRFCNTCMGSDLELPLRATSMN